MRVRPDHPLPALSYRPESIRGVEPVFDEVRRQQSELVANLPSLYEYLRDFHGTE